DVVRIGILGKPETARERAVEALDTKLVLALVLLLVLALAAERDDAVLDGDLDVLLLHLGKLGPDQVLLVRFADVGHRRPFDFLATEAAQAAAEERREVAEEFLHVPERFPAGERARLPSCQIHKLP